MAKQPGLLTPRQLGLSTVGPNPDPGRQLDYIYRAQRAPIAPINEYDEGLNVYNIGFRNELRGDNMSTGEKALYAAGNILPNIGLGIVETVGLLAEGVGYAASGLTGTLKKEELDFKNIITEAANRGKNPIDIYWETERQREQSFAADISSAEWWIQNGAGLVESIASFAATGMGVGTVLSKGTSLAAKGLAKGFRMQAAKAATTAVNAQVAAQGLTAATLAYTEGAMSGATVYNEVYKYNLAKFKSAVANGDMTQEEADLQARRIAGSAASTTVAMNTFINTALNYTGLNGLFINAKNPMKAFGQSVSQFADDLPRALQQAAIGNFDDYAVRATKNAFRKTLSESVQESMEEYVNVLSEAVGINQGTEGLKSGLDLVIDTFTSREGVEAMLLGAIGGAGQNLIIENLAGSGFQQDQDGKYKFSFASKAQRAREAFDQYKKEIVEDLTALKNIDDKRKAAYDEIQDINKKLKSGATDPALRKRLDQLEAEYQADGFNAFILGNYKSISGGNIDVVYAALERYANIDFNTPLSQSRSEQYDALTQEGANLTNELTTNASQMSPEQIAEIRSRLEKIDKEKLFLETNTEASEMGFTPESETFVKEQTKEALKYLKDFESILKAPSNRRDFMISLEQTRIRNTYAKQADAYNELIKEVRNSDELTDDDKALLIKELEKEKEALKKQGKAAEKKVEKAFDDAQKTKKDMAQEAQSFKDVKPVEVTPEQAEEKAEESTAEDPTEPQTPADPEPTEGKQLIEPGTTVDLTDPSPDEGPIIPTGETVEFTTDQFGRPFESETSSDPQPDDEQADDPVEDAETIAEEEIAEQVIENADYGDANTTAVFRDYNTSRSFGATQRVLKPNEEVDFVVGNPTNTSLRDTQVAIYYKEHNGKRLLALPEELGTDPGFRRVKNYTFGEFMRDLKDYDLSSYAAKGMTAEDALVLFVPMAIYTKEGEFVHFARSPFVTDQGDTDSIAAKRRNENVAAFRLGNKEAIYNEILNPTGGAVVNMATSEIRVMQELHNNLGSTENVNQFPSELDPKQIVVKQTADGAVYLDPLTGQKASLTTEEKATLDKAIKHNVDGTGDGFSFLVHKRYDGEPNARYVRPKALTPDMKRKITEYSRNILVNYVRGLDSYISQSAGGNGQEFINRFYRPLNDLIKAFRPVVDINFLKDEPQFVPAKTKGIFEKPRYKIRANFTEHILDQTRGDEYNPEPLKKVHVHVDTLGRILVYNPATFQQSLQKSSEDFSALSAEQIRASAIYRSIIVIEPLFFEDPESAMDKQLVEQAEKKMIAKLDIALKLMYDYEENQRLNLPVGLTEDGKKYIKDVLAAPNQTNDQAYRQFIGESWTVIVPSTDKILYTFSKSTGLDAKPITPKPVAPLTPDPSTTDIGSSLGAKLSVIKSNASFIKLVEEQDGTSYYYNTLTKTKYMRVSNYIGKPIDFEKMNSRQRAMVETSLELGSEVDIFVRDYFEGKISSTSDLQAISEQYRFASSTALDELIEQLDQLKAYFDSRGETVIPTDVVLYSDQLKLAGTVDLLTYDKDGVFRIYDMKTMRGHQPTSVHKGGPNKGKNAYDTPYDPAQDSNRLKHQKQLSLYKILLEQTHGVEVKELNIIPIPINYQPGDNTVSSIDLPVDKNGKGLIPHKPLTRVEYWDAKNQPKQSTTVFDETVLAEEAEQLPARETGEEGPAPAVETPSNEEAELEKKKQQARKNLNKFFNDRSIGGKRSNFLNSIEEVYELGSVRLSPEQILGMEKDPSQGGTYPTYVVERFSNYYFGVALQKAYLEFVSGKDTFRDIRSYIEDEIIRDRDQLRQSGILEVLDGAEPTIDNLREVFGVDNYSNHQVFMASMLLNMDRITMVQSINSVMTNLGKINAVKVKDISLLESLNPAVYAERRKKKVARSIKRIQDRITSMESGELLAQRDAKVSQMIADGREEQSKGYRKRYNFKLRRNKRKLKTYEKLLAKLTGNDTVVSQEYMTSELKRIGLRLEGDPQETDLEESITRYDNKEDTDHFFNDSQIGVNLQDKVSNRLRMFMATLSKNDGTGGYYNFNYVFNMVLNISRDVTQPTWPALRKALNDFYISTGKDSVRFGFIPQLIEAAERGKQFYIGGEFYKVDPIANELVARMNAKKLTMFKITKKADEYTIINENYKNINNTVRDRMLEGFISKGLALDTLTGRFVSPSRDPNSAGAKFVAAMTEYNEAVAPLGLNEEDVLMGLTSEDQEQARIDQIRSVGYPLFRKAFLAIGIDVAPGTYESIASRNYYAPFDISEGEPINKKGEGQPIIKYLAYHLYHSTRRKQLSGSNSFMSGLPMRELIGYEANFNTGVIYASQSFQSGGRSIYGFNSPRQINDGVDAYKDPTILDIGSGLSRQQHMSDGTLFTSGSFVEDQYQASGEGRDQIAVSVTALDPLSTEGEGSRRNREIHKQGPAVHEEYKVNMFLESKNQLDRDGKRGHRRFFLPTMSNKKVVAMIDMPYYRLYNAYDEGTDDVIITEELVNDFYKYVIQPEIDRIYAFGTNTSPAQIGYTPQIAYLSPWVNKFIYKKGAQTRTDKELAVREIKKAIPDFIKGNVYKQINTWEDLGLIRLDKEGTVKRSSIGSIKRGVRNYTRPSIIQTAFEYFVQYQIATMSSFQMIIGDPANYSKFKVRSGDYLGELTRDPSDIYFAALADETYNNVGKRLAALLAPGIVGDISYGSTETKAVLKKILKRAKLRIGDFDVAIFNDEEIGSPFQEEIETALIAAYGSAKGLELAASYKGMETTDGGAFISVREYMLHAYSKGEITLSQFNAFMQDWENNLSASESDLIKKHLGPKFAFGVNKPVITEMFHEKVSTLEGDKHVPRIMYGKIAATVLTRDFTKNFPTLNMMRESMESNGISYLLPSSGVKGSKFNTVLQGGGARIKTILKDGVLDTKAISSLPMSKVTLSRRALKTQQNIPDKTIKGATQVTLSTQAKKLFLVNMLDLDFNPSSLLTEDMRAFITNVLEEEIEEGEIKGADIRRLHDSIYKELVSTQIDLLLAELSLEELGEDGDIPQDIKASEDFKQSISDLLVEEILKRGGSPLMRDVVAIDELSKDFRANPFMVAGNEKLQSIVMSILNKTMNNIKTSGFGGTLVPDMGVGIQAVMVEQDGETVELDYPTLASKVIHVTGADGKKRLGNRLRYITDDTGDIKYAQIIVPSTVFSDNEGKVIDIYKLATKDEDGRLILDPSKIDPDILKIFGLRIPNSGPNSNASMEIVGFLPPSMGDGMIVPAEFIRQMGSDFDADKMYNYVKNVQTDEEGKITALKVDEDSSLNDQVKHYQNLLMDVYKYVSGYDNKLSRAMTHLPLEYGFLFKDDVDENAKLPVQQMLRAATLSGEDPALFSPLSPSYQSKKYIGGAAAQVMVGIMSNAVAANGLLQNSGIAFVDANFKIGNIVGNPKPFQKYGKNSENKKGRTIHDVLVAYQSMSLDDEKFQQLGRLNINADTSSVIQALALYGFDEEAIQAVIMQPVVKNFLDFKNNYRFSDEKAYAAALAYSEGVSVNDILQMGEDILERGISRKGGPQLNLSIRALSSNMANPNPSADRQILEFYKAANAIGTLFTSKVVPLTNLDSASFGKDVFQLEDRVRKFEDLNKRVTGVKSYMQKQTLSSIHYKAGKLASAIFDKAFNLNASAAFNYDVTKELEPDLDESTDRSNFFRALHRAGIAYINGLTTNPLFKGTAYDQRRRLLVGMNIFQQGESGKYSKVAQKENLASQIYKAREIAILSDNLFLRSLGVKNIMSRDILGTNVTSEYYSEISISSGDGVSLDSLRTAFMDLYSSDVEIGEWNGQHYSSRDLALDLIAYSAVTGFPANSPIAVVPYTLLEGLGYFEFLKKETANQANFDKRLVDQFIAHNPAMFPRMERPEDSDHMQFEIQGDNLPDTVHTVERGIPIAYVRTLHVESDIGPDFNTYSRVEPKVNFPFSEYSDVNPGSFSSIHKKLGTTTVGGLLQADAEATATGLALLDAENNYADTYDIQPYSLDNLINDLSNAEELANAPLLKVVAALRENLGDIAFSLADLGPKRVGRYDVKEHKIEFNSVTFSKVSPEKLLKVLAEEMAHAHTAYITQIVDKLKVQVADPLNHIKNNVEDPTLKSSLLSALRMDNLRLKMVDSLGEDKAAFEKFKVKLALAASGALEYPTDIYYEGVKIIEAGEKVTPFTRKERNLFYPLTNNAEFVAAALSNERFIEELGDQRYSPNKSFWQELVEILKSLMNRIVDLFDLNTEQKNSYREVVKDVLNITQANHLEYTDAQLGLTIDQSVEDESSVPVDADLASYRTFDPLKRYTGRARVVELRNPITGVLEQYTVEASIEDGGVIYLIKNEAGDSIFEENSPQRVRILIEYFKANRIGKRNIIVDGGRYIIDDNSEIYSEDTSSIVTDRALREKIVIMASNEPRLNSIEMYESTLEKILNKIDCAR